MSCFNAAKIFLGHLLYLNATVKERKKGLYSPNCMDAGFNEAVKILKEFKRLPSKPEHISGGYMIIAAISAAKRR